MLSTKSLLLLLPLLSILNAKPVPCDDDDHSPSNHGGGNNNHGMLLNGDCRLGTSARRDTIGATIDVSSAAATTMSVGMMGRDVVNIVAMGTNTLIGAKGHIPVHDHFALLPCFCLDELSFIDPLAMEQEIVLATTVQMGNTGRTRAVAAWITTTATSNSIGILTKDTNDTKCPHGYRFRHGRCQRDEYDDGDSDYSKDCNDPNKFVNDRGYCVPVKCNKPKVRNSKGFCIDPVRLLFLSAVVTTTTVLAKGDVTKRGLSFGDQCSKGYHWSNNRCVLSGCDDDERWDDGAGCCKYRCDWNEHFDWSEGNCVSNNCPNGKHWSNKSGRCMDNHNCDKQQYWDPDKGQCLNHVCPGGTKYSDEHDRCVKKCPPGEIKKNGHCVDRDTNDTKCPHGYRFRHGRCQRDEYDDGDSDYSKDCNDPNKFVNDRGYCVPVKCNKPKVRNSKGFCIDPKNGGSHSNPCGPGEILSVNGLGLEVCIDGNINIGGHPHPGNGGDRDDNDGDHNNRDHGNQDNDGRDYGDDGQDRRCGHGQVQAMNGQGRHVCVKDEGNKCGNNQVLSVNALGIQLCVGLGDDGKPRNNVDNDNNCPPGQVPTFRNGRMVCADHNINIGGNPRHGSDKKCDNDEVVAVNLAGAKVCVGDSGLKCNNGRILSINALGLHVCAEVGDNGKPKKKTCGSGQTLSVNALGIQVCLGGSSGDGQKKCGNGEVVAVNTNGKKICVADKGKSCTGNTVLSLNALGVQVCVGLGSDGKPKVKKCPDGQVLKVNAIGVQVCVDVNLGEDPHPQKKCPQGQTLHVNALGIEVCVDLNLGGDVDSSPKKNCPKGQTLQVNAAGIAVCVDLNLGSDGDHGNDPRPKKKCPRGQTLEVNALGAEVCVDLNVGDDNSDSKKKCPPGQTLEVNALGLSVCVDVNLGLGINLKRRDDFKCTSHQVLARTLAGVPSANIFCSQAVMALVLQYDFV
ncbi:hypothetical protein BT69DRAFT_1318933 [Atractiella rhizophila]|nr:hypothetical protein BT69DRAFT_1318933 [Atractiella rhizophila]